MLKALDAGKNVSEAAKAGQVSRITVRRISDADNRPWPPPGARKGSGKRPAKITRAQALEALGPRLPNGRWANSGESAAATLGVSRSALYQALKRPAENEEKRSEERKS